MDVDVNVIIEDDLNDFGRFLRKSRKEKHLTQAELAKLSGLSVMSVRRYESNERHPGLEEMIKLGKILGFVMTVDADFQKTIHTEGHFSLDENWQSNVSSLGHSHQKLEKLTCLFSKLNPSGKDKAIEMVTMLTHVPEYSEMEEQNNGQSDE